MTTSGEVQAIGRAFAGGLRSILAEKLVGVYIYGAAAFPDDVPTGDVDFHVILQEPLTGEERAVLDRLHATIARDFPPLGAEMDGHYLLLADARRRQPPDSQMWGVTDGAWALHRAHIRAGRCIVLHGSDPLEIYPPATPAELQTALWDELEYVERHLHKYPDYCILNLCRLMYSFQTGDVVISKAAAAKWAYDHLPAWQRFIDLARKSYSREGTAAERQEMLAEVEGLYEEAVARIERDAGKRP